MLMSGKYFLDFVPLYIVCDTMIQFCLAYSLLTHCMYLFFMIAFYGILHAHITTGCAFLLPRNNLNTIFINFEMKTVINNIFCNSLFMLSVFVLNCKSGHSTKPFQFLQKNYIKMHLYQILKYGAILPLNVIIPNLQMEFSIQNIHVPCSKWLGKPNI